MLPHEVYECSSRSPRDRYKSNLRKHPTVTKALKGTVTLTFGQSVYSYFLTSALHVSTVISLCFMDCYNKLLNISMSFEFFLLCPHRQSEFPHTTVNVTNALHIYHTDNYTHHLDKNTLHLFEKQILSIYPIVISLCIIVRFFLVGQIIHIKIQGPPTETSVAFHNRLCSSVCVNRSLQLGTSASRHHSSSYSPRCHLTSKTSYKTSKICMYIICFKMLRNPQKMNG